MKHAGKLSLCALLRQSQLRRQPAQLDCSLFQLRMTSAESFLRLFLQSAIMLLVAASLALLFGATALRDIQLEPGEPYYLSVGIAMRVAQTLYPRDGPIGPHNAEWCQRCL